METKEPIVKCEPELIKYQNDEVSFISKVFVTKQGAGRRGVWEYAKTVDSNIVFVNVVLVAKSQKTDERVVIVRKEIEAATREGQAISSFYFGNINNEMNLDYHKEVEKMMLEKGIGNTKILTSSGVCQGFYTDPWKSN